ncbi:D-alanine--D-alanine ligase [Blattabacterium cuenoti]|uniref:D-alanine--D-alanine ligase n=1 Tax=Blattabacterium cuenoti TaxID=1653831 RepID=UPI00163C5319|nr:D-alanine--D-alanine ligase [Blattabacterium cuenoti]
MKKTIAIIVGGYTDEAPISLNSGKFVLKHLNKDEFDPYLVYIFRKTWFFKDENNIKYLVNRHNFTIRLSNNNILKFDCIFNAIHGSPGEDGIMQAYFDLLNIPYTGCNFHHSNLTFNKIYCLTLLKEYGINTATSFFLNQNQLFCEHQILDKVGLPCFVKPNKSGSSLGISKVYNKNQLLTSITNAFKQDEEILIESYLSGIELSVGVIAFNKNITVLPITEIISQNDFFDFESKYSGKSHEITPARISQKIENKMKHIAKQVCKILNLKGISRSEYIIVNETPFFLEINTVPGFSDKSIFPKQLQHAGYSLSNFLKEFIYYSIDKIK